MEINPNKPVFTIKVTRLNLSQNFTSLRIFIWFLYYHWGHIRSFSSVQFSSVAQLCRTLCDPKTTANQASLSITNCWSLPKLMSIELIIPSNHHILCRPFFLLPSIFPSIRVFSNESALCIRWPKYWSFSFNIIPSKEHPGLICFRMD